MAILQVLGTNPSGNRLKRIENSPHYADGAFQNPEPTEMILEGASYFKMIREYMNKPGTTAPPSPIPAIRSDLFSLPAEGPVVVWFGHSSYFIKWHGKCILVDPVFSGHASPFAWFGRSFPGTIRQFAAKTRHFYVSLGVGSHLEYWGIGSGKITELDWGETAKIGDTLSLTATPARHFSGRTLKRNRTLWSSFVLKAGDTTIFLGGDSGYGAHFKTIGEQYGPFDLAILECGQYGKNWPYIHMFPEQTVAAATDLGAKAVLPVHWCKFVLSLHDWNDPIRRVAQTAKQKGLPLATPKIGEPFLIGTAYPREIWWEL